MRNLWFPKELCKTYNFCYISEQPCAAKPCKDGEFCLALGSEKLKYRNRSHMCYNFNRVVRALETLDQRKFLFFFIISSDCKCQFGNLYRIRELTVPVPF